MKKQMFVWTLARVNMKLEEWKKKLISRTEKELLIKTVVQALSQFAMSVFKIPLSICKAIKQLSSGNKMKQRQGALEEMRITQNQDDEEMIFRDLISLTKQC